MLNDAEQIFLYCGRMKTEVRWSELFSDTSLRWTCLALHALCAATILTYYGALLNVQNLGQHLHFNIVMAGKEGIIKQNRMRYGVLTVAQLKIQVFWDMTLC
jgi:hypothetical protein